MEMETSLPETPLEIGANGEPGTIPDGLAAEVAAEQIAQPSPAGGGLQTPSGKRPGRPPIHGMYSRAAGSDGKNPVPLPGPAPLATPQVDHSPSPRVALPADLLTRVVAQTLTFAEASLQSLIEGQARAAGLTSAEIVPQLKRAELGNQSKALVAEITPLALDEWGLDVNVSPSTAIGVILLPWLTGSGLAYFTLAALAKERAKQPRLVAVPVPIKMESQRAEAK